MEPSNTPAGRKLLNAFTGVDTAETIKAGVCWSCGRSVDPETIWRDEESRAEFLISGLCQKCQDYTFGLEGTEPEELTGAVCANCGGFLRPTESTVHEECFAAFVDYLNKPIQRYDDE